MAYVRKTRDEYVLMCNYGYGDGWEELFCEDTLAEARRVKREYEENMPQYPYKIAKKRVPLNS